LPRTGEVETEFLVSGEANEVPLIGEGPARFGQRAEPGSCQRPFQPVARLLQLRVPLEDYRLQLLQLRVFRRQVMAGLDRGRFLVAGVDAERSPLTSEAGTAAPVRPVSTARGP
jgi:hypothetical protein